MEPGVRLLIVFAKLVIGMSGTKPTGRSAARRRLAERAAQSSMTTRFSAIAAMSGAGSTEPRLGPASHARDRQPRKRRRTIETGSHTTGFRRTRIIGGLDRSWLADQE